MTGTMQYNTGTVTERMTMGIMKLKDKTILKNLRNGKSSGGDNIPSELHKYANEKFKTNLLRFLNKIYISGTTAAEWNSVMILLIYKKEDMKDPDNCKGITN
jgi:hypothetical protein